jgi:hypothetical protein
MGRTGRAALKPKVESIGLVRLGPRLARAKLESFSGSTGLQGDKRKEPGGSKLPRAEQADGGSER